MISQLAPVGGGEGAGANSRVTAERALREVSVSNREAAGKRREAVISCVGNH